MVMEGGHNITGNPVGVIALDSRFQKPPGHIKKPQLIEILRALRPAR